MTTVRFDRRFRGPLTSANGGYAAGTLAQLVESDDAVEVTLRQPPPLDRDLLVDGGRLLDDGLLVAEATAVTLDLEPPVVTLDEATAAGARSEREGDPAFAECFSCGERAEADGLAIHPGPVAGDPRTKAAVWVPTEVSPPVVWSAIDCTGAYAMAESGRGDAVLGRMTARVDRLPEIGESYVVVGWPIEARGRTLTAGTALLGRDGEVLARSRQVWIAPRSSE